jgi:two-component system, chemotaxis family, chemotaxis protein CheY
MILVVDDNRQLCETISEFLSLRGHAVECAANGNEALRLLAGLQTRPALILLDVGMPVLDGWGTLTELHKNPRLADVPVVMMSGYRDIAQKAKESGAAAVVRKPVEPDTLLGIIDHFAERA